MVYLIKTNLGIEACEKALKNNTLFFRQLFNGYWVAPVSTVKTVIQVDENYFFNNPKPIEKIYDEFKNRKSNN